MLRYQIHSEGVEKMLNEMRRQMPNKIEEAVDKAIDAGIRSAEYLVPKDTRKLKFSIKRDAPTKKLFGGTVEASYSALARNKKGHNYGFYQETGWTDIKGNYHEGRYYMKRSKDKAEKVFVKECNKILGRYTK